MHVYEATPGPVARANFSEGHSEPNPSKMGPPGVQGLFIPGSK